ncbi:MAG: response regulator [Deltaproteobacteria bacterium]|nr:response regulator [Deltaproteobacteria bacterium]
MRKVENRTFNILVVEDSPGDRKLVSHLFRECTPPCQLFFAADGEEATEFIFKRGQFETAVTPDLVILDLNMPNKDGRDVLKEIKTTPNLKRIPVVVLTTSSSHQDVDAAYEFQARRRARRTKGPAISSDRVGVGFATCSKTLNHPRGRFVLITIAVASAYCLGAKLGFFTALAHKSVAPVWPPTGIAISAVLMWGMGALPGVALGAFLANTFVTPIPWPIAGLFALGNTLEAVTAAWLVKRYAPHFVDLDRASMDKVQARFGSRGGRVISAERFCSLPGS